MFFRTIISSSGIIVKRVVPFFNIIYTVENGEFFWNGYHKMHNISNEKISYFISKPTTKMHNISEQSGTVPMSFVHGEMIHTSFVEDVK